MEVNRNILMGVAFCGQLMMGAAKNAGTDNADTRPNILFCVVDDVSFGHWGCYGAKWVHTPACDYVASSGALFTRAFTPNAKSGPSRSCILTGLNSWQLGPAANHFAFFPEDVRSFPEVLAEHGYQVGMTGKGWFPGDPGRQNGKPRELIGKRYNRIKCNPPYPTVSNIDYSANFRLFLKKRNAEEPFFFWYGGWEAHRPYTPGSGISENRTGESVDRVPGIYPDCATVRTDMCDYAFEIEYFDSHLSRMIAMLDDEGILDNTIIVVTSDNGMSFPRIKGQCYYDSHHMPLVIMWPGRIEPGIVIDSFVSFTDFAPTILDAARIRPEESGMKPFEGKSLLNLLKNTDDDPRPFMCIGKERHDIGRPGDAGYPIRGIITEKWLYLVNYESSRDPAGNPETGYLNYDASPTKTLLLGRKNRYYRLSFGKRPAEELYDIVSDPDCIDNLARKRFAAPICDSLRSIMENKLVEDGDPRMFGRGDEFDRYEFSNPLYRNYYDRLMRNDSIPLPNWIVPSDVDWKRQHRLRGRVHPL